MTIHYQTIISYLDKQKISYHTKHHEQTPTSEDSARARGESIAIGGKALLVKAGDKPVLVVLSAAKKIDNKKLQIALETKKTRFLSAEELFTLTGLVPGSVPPFGEPLFPYSCIVDRSITENDHIAFNAGSLTDSVIMKTQDYLALTGYTIVDIAE